MSSETGGSRSFGREFSIPVDIREKIHDYSVWISGAVIFVVGLFPIYWMAQSAFNRQTTLGQEISFFPGPADFTLRNFEVVTNDAILNYAINSAIITFGTIITVVVVSLIAGYGLARFDFWGKVNFARLLLLGYLFSPIVLALPLFLIWDRTGLLNTHIGVIIALSAISMPFAVWLMWKYIQTIPLSMEESAWISGAPRWRGVKDIVFPQTMPAIMANGLFSFALAWNDFTFSEILLPSDAARTLPPGLLHQVNTSQATTPAELMGAGLLMTLPPLIFAYFLQSYLLKGFEIRSL
jgi:multiple sugar transport system permease protein